MAAGRRTLPGAATPDPQAALSELPAAAEQARRHERQLMAGLAVRRLPPFRLVVMGPASSGKTVLVHGLLGTPIDRIDSRLSAQTRAVTTYVPGPTFQIAGMPPDGAHSGRVEVESPAEFLRAWDAVLIDTPGMDPRHGSDLQLPEESRCSGTAVVYVVPFRGPTEEDIRVLELLRGTPTLLLENHRESEISGHGALIEATATPGMASPLSLPMVLSRLAGHGPERSAMNQVLGLLRQLTLPDGYVLDLAEEVDDQQRQLRQDYAARFDTVIRGLSADNPVDVLQLTANLVRLADEGAAVCRLDQSLGRLAALAHAVPAIDQTRMQAESVARRSADRYTVEGAERTTRTSRTCPAAAQPSAGTIRVTSNALQSDGPAFGSALRRHRESLLGYLGNIAQDVPLGLIDVERSALARLVKEVSSDRFEMVVVGQFSAGKSSLLNALLDLGDGQQLLPTRLKPTTATINRIVHGPEIVVTPRWLEATDLTLLHVDEGLGAYRVHVEEITALVRWLRRGAVRIEDCRFTLLSNASRSPEQVGQLLEELARTLGIDARATEYTGPQRTPRWNRRLQKSPHEGMGNESGQNPQKVPDYIYDPQFRLTRAKDDTSCYLPSPDVPVEVRVRRFAKPPLVECDGPSAVDILDRISTDPAQALRVDTLTISHPADLLQYVVLVDTPGTDAPVPRHRICTRDAIVQKRERAVIYCFPGFKPAGSEDRDNLEYLRNCNIGVDELARFFFVITQKGNYSTEEQTEIRARVAGLLCGAGLGTLQLYFTEVKHERNDEFQALAAQLNSFSIASRKPLLRAHAMTALNLVANVHQRHESTLQSSRDSEQRRRERLAELQTTVHAIRALRDQFETSTVWGLPSVKADVNATLGSRTKDIADDIAALVNRTQFDLHASGLPASLDDLNQTIARSATRAWQAACSKLGSELASLGAQPVEAHAPALPREIFPSSALREAVKAVSWRSNWDKFKGIFGRNRRSWGSDVELNRQRIEDAWARSRASGSQVVEQVLNLAGSRVLEDLHRSTRILDTEITNNSQPPNAAAVDRATTGVDGALKWRVRIEALIRTIGTLPESSSCAPANTTTQGASCE